jgi:hypothetical protein
MTDELAVQDILKQLKNKADWELLSKAYYDFQVGKTKHRYRTGDLKKDLQGVMSEKYYAQYVASELTRIGVNPGEGTGTDDKDSGDVTGNGEVDKGAGKFTVVPRKGGQGNNRMFGYDVKDANGNTVAKFGKQEKAAAEAEAARLNGGSSTTSSNEPVKKADDGSTDANKIPAEKRIADFKTVLSDPNIDLDTIIKVAKEMKADTEVWNMATPGLRKQLDQVIATGGK